MKKKQQHRAVYMFVLLLFVILSAFYLLKVVGAGQAIYSFFHPSTPTPNPSLQTWDSLSSDHLNSYLQTYADSTRYQIAPSETAPYVRLKVVPISVPPSSQPCITINPDYLAINQGFVDALPTELVAQTPSQVGTVLLLNFTYQYLTTYMLETFPGNTPVDVVAYRNDIVVTLIDKEKGLILLTKTFKGSIPPIPLSGNFGIGSCTAVIGQSPKDDVVQFITSLPRK